MADSVVPLGDSDDLLRVAIAAHLARYKGLSRAHTSSDLQVYLRWCTEHQLDPLAVRRADVELFVRWLEEAGRFKPSTVSRRLSVVTCFYRTCVIDAVLNASPAAYVRRPPVSSESPTLGLSHLQFEDSGGAAERDATDVNVEGLQGTRERQSESQGPRATTMPCAGLGRRSPRPPLHRTAEG